MIRRLSFVAAAGLMLLNVAPASAQSCQTNLANLVQNCSFEQGNVKNGADYPNADVPFWTNVYAPNGGTFERWTNGFDGFFAQDGNSHIELQVNGPTFIQQVLGTTAGQNYSLSFWSAHRPRDNGGFSQLDVYVNGNLLTSTGQIFDPYEWHNYSASFVATGSDAIEFRSMGNQLSYGDFLDNVTVEGDVSTQAVVPEPSTFALLGVGIAMAGVVSRKRRRVA